MWRYELKYILEPTQWFQLQQVLTEHPASFVTAYDDRIINNIYLDTPDFSTCRDNLAGIAQREKYRIRWYGEVAAMENPVLETKIKNNSLGRKKIQPLQNINILTDFSQVSAQSLRPTLQNQYLRSYFVSHSGKFRLTVDRNIKYFKCDGAVDTHLQAAIFDPRIIVEIKFKAEDLEHQKDITRFIPFRMSKHSKYVTGILSCYDGF